MAEPSVKYRMAECKTLLNKSGIADYTVNCYTGCAHACVYCYARFVARYSHPAEKWGGFVDIKANAPQVLAREVKRKPAGRVMLSSACDGWQPAEAGCGLTRQCLEILLRYRFRVSILTKNALAARDLDIMAPDRTELGVTLTTLDAGLAARLEPGASPPQQRLELLQKAKNKGISTFAFLGPLLPALEDNEQNVTALLKALKDAGVAEILVDKLNLRYGVWPALVQFLGQHYPALLPEYRRIFFTPAGQAEYASGLKSLVENVAGKLGMRDRLNICIRPAVPSSYGPN